MDDLTFKSTFSVLAYHSSIAAYICSKGKSSLLDDSDSLNLERRKQSEN